MASPNLLVSGTSRRLQAKLRVGVDYFNPPTSAWKAALEPWDLDIGYAASPAGRREGGGWEVNVDAPDEVAMVRVSAAAIDSLLRAIHTWTAAGAGASSSAIQAAAGGGTECADTTEVSAHQQPLSPEEESFVPYTVRNLLAEPLLVIMEDGAECQVAPGASLALTYQQVWRRRGIAALRFDESEHGISNHVCLQLVGAKHVFCRVSVETEQTTSYAIEAALPEGAAGPRGPVGGTRSVPLLIVCDLAQRHGRKVLSVSSMVTVRNCSSITAEAALLSPGGKLETIGILPPGGAVAVPLRAARDGTVCVRPLIQGLEYQWSSPESEGIKLRAVHDGTLRLTQQVDPRFQKLFSAKLDSAKLGGDPTLVAWFNCANDVEGVLRQGVLYVTDVALCHYSNIIGVEVKDVIPLANITSLEKVYTAYVFPNAIRVATARKVWVFRTLRNRAEAYRTILGLLPDKAVATNKADDLDETARRAFGLAPADTIQALHSSVFLHPDTPSPPAQGYLILTTKHVFWASPDFAQRRRLPWAGVASAEKRKSFVIRNNAIEILGAPGGAGGAEKMFLSSSKWDRDAVLADEILPLLHAASASTDAASSAGNLGGTGAAGARGEDVSEAGSSARASSR